MKKIIDFFKKVTTIFENWKITIHPLFVAVGVLFLILGNIFVFCVTTLSCVLHELAHAVVAKRLGYHLKKIRLMPFGAELSGEDQFLNGHEIKIAIAGPFFNLFVCFVCVCLWWIFPETYSISVEICAINLVLGVFNLFPFFPLDGGRVLVAFISKSWPREKSVKFAKNCTIVFSVLLFFLFLISLFFVFNFTFGILAVGLFVASISENKKLGYERLISKSFKRNRVKTSGLEQRRVLVDENLSLQKIFLMQNTRFFSIFVVVDSDLNKNFEISESELENFLVRFPASTKLKHIKKLQ